MGNRSAEVDEYLAGLNAGRREALSIVRALVLDTVPDAHEPMKYRMPTYEYSGGVLCALASQKRYVSLYMNPDLVDHYREDLSGLDLGKSRIRFRKLDKLPLDTIGRMLRESADNQLGM